MNAAADAAQVDLGGGEGVAFAKHYEALPGVRLPQYDTPTAQAFAVRDKRTAGRRLFALVCGVEPHPRLEIVSSLARTDSHALIAPERWGIVFWPPLQQERFLILFEQRGTERFVTSNDARWEPMREDVLVKHVLEPILPVLVELMRSSVTHRAIRPDNLFYADDTKTTMILGECVSAPPAFLQPPAFETIPSLMADPLGRGTGTQSDDLYALGVLVASLLSGRDPCAGMTADEVAKSKIEVGTFGTLFDGSRTILTLMEPLRGLLADEPGDRWTLNELLPWLDGRKQTPKQVKRPAKAQRQFEFDGKKYDSLRELARAMGRNWDASVELVRDPPKLLDWLERGLAERDRPDGLCDSASSILGRGLASNSAANAAVAKLLILFDPAAPIRYRGISTHLEAFGLTFASLHEDAAAIKSFQEMMQAKLPGVWLEMQVNAGPMATLLKKAIEIADYNLPKRGWGFGVERCLYELNPTWPCQSPLLQNRFVCSVPQLLVALEQIAANNPDGSPIDRHIVAFCAARLKGLPTRAYQDLSDEGDEAGQRIASLRFLAAIQHLQGSVSLPAMSRWMARLVGSVIESFNNKPYKQLLAEEIERSADEGNLAVLLALADNQNASDRDRLGFAQATRKFAEASQEIVWLEDGGLTSENHIRRGSQQATTLISAVLSGVALLCMTMLAVM